MAILGDTWRYLAILGVSLLTLAACDVSGSEWAAENLTDRATGDTGLWALDGSGANGDLTEREILETSLLELIWKPGATWEPFLNFRNSTNATHARHSLYGRATANYFWPIGGGLADTCTGFMISRDRLATAHHCTQGRPDITTVQFVPSTPFAELETRELLEGLGFFSSQLDAAVALARSAWTCTWHSKHPSRDIEYYTCWARTFQIAPGYSVSLHPGDIFGHFDITTSLPPNQANTNALTVNELLPSSDREVLLSPNGHRQAGLADSCWGGYSSCAATQGDDTLPGSSGGASIRSSNNLVWGVFNGYSWGPGSDPGRNPVCYDGFCDFNLNKWARLSSYTTSLQYWSRISDLVAPSTTVGTTTLGGSGGSPYGFFCEDDEAVIGIVGSQYEDQWAPSGGDPLVLGNFGIVCGPGRDSSGHFLQSDHAYVYTAGSYDTGFSSSLAPAPLRFNRYRNTVLAQGRQYFPNDEIESFICPAGYAVSSISARIKYSKVRAITQIRCRHMFNSSFTDYTYGLTNFGTTESGSTGATASCGTGQFVVGAYTQSGWFTDSIRLTCGL
jgi:hypothetical protein